MYLVRLLWAWWCVLLKICNKISVSICAIISKGWKKLCKTEFTMHRNQNMSAITDCVCVWVFCFFLAYLKFRACALFCELIFRLYMIMDSQRINCKIALLVRCLRCQSTISSQRSTYTGVQGWNGSQWPYFKLVWAIKQSLTNHILHTVDLWSHHL